jgi:hypothetical protein
MARTPTGPAAKRKKPRATATAGAPAAPAAPATHPTPHQTTHPGVPPAVNISAATDVRPPVTGVTSSMEPLAAAGLELTKIVLTLITLSILILTAILAWVEFGAARQAARANEQALAIAAMGRAGPQDARLEFLSVELRRAGDDPTWTMPEASAAEGLAVTRQLAADPSLTQAQRDLVGKCLPLPAAAATGRAEALAQCAALTDQVLAARQSPGERLKFMADLQKQSDDQRQAFRAFWLQVAQLILMNLFFPLLTALLGYIFGTQQARKG